MLGQGACRVRVWGEDAGSRRVWVRVVLEVEEAHALFHATKFTGEGVG